MFQRGALTLLPPSLLRHGDGGSRDGLHGRHSQTDDEVLSELEVDVVEQQHLRTGVGLQLLPQRLEVRHGRPVEYVIEDGLLVDLLPRALLRHVHVRF